LGEKMKRDLLLFCLLFFVSGCSTLNGSVPFHYVPSLSTMPQNTAKLGMEKFVDSRPSDDKLATKNIPDVDEKVTSKLLEDFRSSRMFSDIDFPPLRNKDGLILKGEIKRFYWKTKDNPIKFIPVVNLLLLLGITSCEIEAVVELKVQIVDAKTGVILSEYDKTSTKKDRATLYDGRSGEPGAELAETFREVAKQIKDAISKDILNGKIKLSKRNGRTLT